MRITHALSLITVCLVATSPAAAGGIAAGKFAVCVGCHSLDGNSANPEVPKLAEQNAEYLYKELWDFQEGKRPSTLMLPLYPRSASKI